MNPISSLEILSSKIKEGIDNNTSLKNLSYLLLDYSGDDWKNYSKFCEYGYKRNRVYIDSHIEVLVICWNVYQKSGIHDHPKNGCILKVVKGKLKEDVYKRNSNYELEFVKTNVLTSNTVSYQEGKEGLHNVRNNDEECAVSIHVYSPPNYKQNFFNKL